MNKNSNFLGEQYRDKGFIPDEYGNNFGCYNTFETAPSFKQLKISTKNQKHLDNIKKMVNIIIFNEINNNALFADHQNFDFYAEYFKSVLKYNQFYYSKKLNLYMAWYWDGDGTLVFIDSNDNIIFNRDCKKDSNWQLLNS
jgi:hypothetical protein